MYIIADTCIWVNYLRGAKNFDLERFDKLLIEDMLMLTSPIVEELYMGAKLGHEIHYLNDIIKIIYNVNPILDDWIKTGKIWNHFRKQGISLPLNDIMLGIIAEKYNYTLWTEDNHFKTLKNQLNFNTIY